MPRPFTPTPTESNTLVTDTGPIFTVSFPMQLRDRRDYVLDHGSIDGWLYEMETELPFMEEEEQFNHLLLTANLICLFKIHNGRLPLFTITPGEADDSFYCRVENLVESFCAANHPTLLVAGNQVLNDLYQLYWSRYTRQMQEQPEDWLRELPTSDIIGEQLDVLQDNLNRSFQFGNHVAGKVSHQNGLSLFGYEIYPYLAGHSEALAAWRDSLGLYLEQGIAQGHDLKVLLKPFTRRTQHFDSISTQRSQAHYYLLLCDTLIELTKRGVIAPQELEQLREQSSNINNYETYWLWLPLIAGDPVAAAGPQNNRQVWDHAFKLNPLKNDQSRTNSRNCQAKSASSTI